MTISSNFPALKPSLLLDFANVKALDPRITFTRTTTATYFDANGVLQTAPAGVARFDHNPTTGESLGLLVEEQRTNLALRSEEFDNAAWSKIRSSITANTIVAPDGTLTGDKLVEDTTASNTHQTDQSITLVASTTYALSLYAKAGERTRIRIAGRIFASWSSFPEAIFDLSAGTVVSGTGTITSVGNGWYRCSVIGTASGTNAGIIVGLVSTGTTFSYTGDGYSGAFIWGAQLESGNFSTSYIATTSASVTRNADAASMTGTNFSGWYRADEGSIFWDGIVNPTNDTEVTLNMFAISDGTSNNAIRLQRRDTTTSDRRIRGQITINTSTNTLIDSNNALFTGAVNHKLGLGYQVNNMALTFDGSLIGTNTSTNIPIVNEMNIGQIAGQAFLNGTIKKLAFYPSRLSDAQLQALTS